MRTIFCLLIFLPAMVWADNSYKFIDLTSEKWREKTDPPLSVENMNIRIGGLKFAKDKFKFTEAAWAIKFPKNIDCKKYSIVFQVSDRLGNLITEESKKYNYPINGASEIKYNANSTNILFDGADHSAKFTKRFDDRKYLTIKYWLKDIQCENSFSIKSKEDSDRVAFTLDSSLDTYNKRKEELIERSKKANSNLVLTFNRPNSG